MNKFILQINIENELDIVVAYRRAMQLSRFCGIAMPNQTKFATAVSEICRNVLEHVGRGSIQYSIIELDGRLYLEGLVADRGRGIPNPEELSRQRTQPNSTKGWGIYNSRKLVEYLFIQSEPDKGTKVFLRKYIPHNHPPINNTVIKGWVEFFKNEIEISPYEEIKNQNMQLIELLDQLRLKNLEVEYQLEEIKRLNAELQTSNHDISGLLDERNSYNQRLEQINRELDKFAHIVSHDLKAPVYNIASLAAIIEECLDENDLKEIRKNTRMIKEQADRMDKFISDVLLYSTTGRQNIAKGHVDLNVLLAQTIRSIAIPDHIRVRVDPGLPVLYTEEIYLQQIFSNLLSNAVKYLNRTEGEIAVGYDLMEGLLQFWVADNGPGIPLADQERIFHPYETSSLHKNRSTGLGLSIVDKIMQLKGTKIWVESKGSNGARFIFTWPVEEMMGKDPLPAQDGPLPGA